MSHAEYARDLIDSVGGAGNVAGVTHCATRLRFRLNDPKRADKEKVGQLKETLGVMEAAGQLQVVIGLSVADVYQDVIAVPGVTGLGEVDAATGQAVGTASPAAPDASATSAPAKKPGIVDRALATISAIFTPWIPLLASVGIIRGLFDVFVKFGWLSSTSNTYVIMTTTFTAMIYFFPVFLGFTGARQFGANPYVGALIGATLLEPAVAAIAKDGAHLHLFGVPFTAQAFGDTVIPILLGTWALGYLERALKRYLPAVTQFLLVPLISVAVMVPLMMLAFGPVGFEIAKGIADAYRGIVHYPVILGLLCGGFYIYVIMLGLHWVVLPIQLSILASQGREYSLASGGMGNYAILGVILAVMIFNRDKETRTVAGSAAFVNFLSGVTEPGIYGIAVKNKWYFVWTTVGGLVGGLFIGITHTYVTAFAFSGLLGSPAFASSPKAVPYFIAVGLTICVSFVCTAVFERRKQSKKAPVEATTTATAAPAASVAV